MTTLQLKNHHLMWRAGFGPATAQLEQLKNISPDRLFKSLKEESEKKPVYLDATDNYFKGLLKGIQEEGKRQELSSEERKNIQRKIREAIKNLNLLWLDEMVESKGQLREKMAFFWHGHFATRNLNIFFQQELIDIIRKNALGNFRDLLHEVSKSAAMLNFLNANQNRKDHPNENFAREVMELFTLGRGNYTEADIREAARAFTGWGANIKGEFVFRKFQHDAGTKTVLGKTGNLTGEEVLDHLLDQKQTAKFITKKIYRFFVNETVPDNEKIEWLSNRFYASDYSISKLMEDIFTSEWFFNEKNMGSKIKSPIELIAGIRRILPMEIGEPEVQLLLQRILGQTLFYPPNVAGWPGGKSWIDSSALMVRMRVPQLFRAGDQLNVEPKDDDDQMMGRMDNKNSKEKNSMGRMGRAVQAEINWTKYLGILDKIPRRELIGEINSILLQVRPGYPESLIQSYTDSSSKENFVKSATIRIMSTPEYQLC